jgi:xanthine/uracil permease
MEENCKQNGSQIGSIKLQYGLDDKPPTAESALYALQWLALALPSIVIVGTVAAGHHFADPALKTIYLQKATFITGLMLLGQALFGHRLTLIAGPATALLLGIIGSRTTPDAVYTAIAISGLLLAIVSAAGLFSFLRELFTSRVIATVLLLIAFTLTPTIVQLLTTGSDGTTSDYLTFAACLIMAMFLAHRFLPAAGRSLLILTGMLVGSVAFFGIFGSAANFENHETIASFFTGFTTPLFDAGVILSFLFCFLALSLNEIGSMQAIAPLLKPQGLDKRIRRGMTVTGGVNAISGMFGVIGPVDYSLSPGVIAASGCGSRFPLITAALILLLVSFSPAILGIAGMIPQAVVGCVLVYTLSGQIAAGLSAAFSGKTFTFEDGIVIGLPILAGTIVAGLPHDIVASFPEAIRSVAGNGFVVGVIAVLLLDRIFRRAA